MYETFKRDRLKASVGIPSQEPSDSFLGFCKDFRRRTGAQLRMVHAIEPWDEYPWIPRYPNENVYAAVVKVAEEEARSRAGERFGALASRLQDVPFETSIVPGDPANVLKADATASGSGLIIVATAAQDRRYDYVPSGLSTALNLMSTSAKPVLAVPEGVDKFQNKDRLQLLYADDLAPGSRQALHVALEMAYGFENVDFHHLHVFRTKRSDLERAGSKLLELLKLADVPFNRDYSLIDPAQSLEDQLSERLRKRVGAADLLLVASRCEYRQLISYGDILEELHGAATKLKPDLIIFGHHELVHRNPFAIGRVPFSAMLSLKVPVVVTPAGH